VENHRIEGLGGCARVNVGRGFEIKFLGKLRDGNRKGNLIKKENGCGFKKLGKGLKRKCGKRKSVDETAGKQHTKKIGQRMSRVLLW